jgi:hypothetical protein
VIGFNSLTIVPTMVLSSIFNMLDEILVHFKKPRDAVESACSNSLFEHTGVVVWDDAIAETPWVALWQTRTRPFGAIGPDRCDTCSNVDIIGRHSLEDGTAKYRFMCTGCRRTTAMDSLVLGRDVIACAGRSYLYWHPMPGRSKLQTTPGWREPQAPAAKRLKTTS